MALVIYLVDAIGCRARQPIGLKSGNNQGGQMPVTTRSYRKKAGKLAATAAVATMVIVIAGGRKLDQHARAMTDFRPDIAVRIGSGFHSRVRMGDDQRTAVLRNQASEWRDGVRRSGLACSRAGREGFAVSTRHHGGAETAIAVDRVGELEAEIRSTC